MAYQSAFQSEFQSAFPILYTEDMGRALRFYRDLLGFAETYRFPDDGEPVYLALRLADSRLGIGTFPPGEESDPFHGRVVRPVAGHRSILCVYAGDIDAAIAELRAAGTPVLSGPTDTPWGERLAYVADPDDNLVLVLARG